MRSSILLSLLLCGTFSTALYAAEGWTDRKEYDLVLEIRAEASPQKQIELLNRWKTLYPSTGMRQIRRELTLAAYQSMGDTARVLETAQEILADQPTNFVGVYWCTVLTPSVKEPKPALMDVAGKASQQLLSGLNQYFEAQHKPKAMPDPDWQKQRAAAEMQANRTSAWILWRRGQLPAAETALTAFVRKYPNNAEVTSWLGYVLAAQDRPIPAAWQFSRAAAMKGAGSVPVAMQRQWDELAGRLYAAYHGDIDGIDTLKTAASAKPFPPDDFRVESADTVRRRKAEEELNRVNPELAAWLRISDQLSGPAGDTYFSTVLKPNPLPKLRGTLINCDQQVKPTQLVLGLSGATAEEVVLKLSAPLAKCADPGTVIEFQATADSFTKTPLQLTAVAAPDAITGWPEK